MNMIDFSEILYENDMFFYLILFALLVVSICLFVVILNQNRQIKKKLENEIDDIIDEKLEESVDLINTKEVPVIKEEVEVLEMEEEPKLEKLEEDVPISVSELEDLQSLTRELELNKVNNRNIELTPYESEQEERAIISYDELIARSDNVSIVYSDSNTNDNILVKKVDLEKTGQIELDPIKKELNKKISSISYEHEESFLQALKELQDLLH